MRPTRPMASWTVATPRAASASTEARSARWILRRTTPNSVMASSSSSLGLQRPVEARIDAARVGFVDLVALIAGQVQRRLDVALGVVVMMAGLGIDAAHRADHFAGEQDVVDRDHFGQQVDARLVVDAGVEEDVVQEVVLEQRLFQLLRKAAVAPPVIGGGAAAVRNDEAQRRKILEQVALDELHHRSRVGVDVMGAGGVE